ncbi:MAG TPA: hypothetical protein PK733_15705, partial [Clostridiales bacterium]|nr:hypothetical protein [Clostridiales bacterium]
MGIMTVLNTIEKDISKQEVKTESYFRVEGQKYFLGNRYIERVWKYDKGSLYTVSILDKVAGYQWVLKHSTIHNSEKDNDWLREISYEGLTNDIRQKDSEERSEYEMQLVDVSSNKVNDSIYSGSYLEIVFHLRDKVHCMDVKRHAVVYDNAPAIRTFIEVKSDKMPMGDFFSGTRLNILDTYPVALDNKYLRSYEFFARTDLTNHLVEERLNPSGFDKGSLVFYCPPDSEGLFFHKESPCFSDQRPEVEGNFRICEKRIETLGWGIRPEEIPEEYKITYSSVIGVFRGNYNCALLALKEYQRERSLIIPERDYSVMANLWGDRQCVEHMNEEFVIKEMEACAKLGVTHYQLDFGWQKRGDKDYWDVHPERFPGGFGRI